LSKTLLVVSGGIEAVPGILKAKEMGLHVVVSDYNPEAPGFRYADDRIIASTYDVQETVAAAEKYHKNIRPLDGVICVASDVPLTVASVAEKLGLPGLSIETAKLAGDKLAMKDQLVREGIPVPWYKPVMSIQELDKVCRVKGFPLIIKPVDSRGARGVLLLDRDIDLQWAFNTAQQNSPTARVMAEEFISGPQISTEAVMVNGIGYNLGFSDRNYEYLERFRPHIIENGGTQPSILSESMQKDIADLAIKAGKALGVVNGIVKGDMVYGPDGPMVIEIATRLSGGYFSTDQIPLHTGVDMLKAAIKLALGEGIKPQELEKKGNRAVAIRYLFPAPGRVVSISGLETARKQEGIVRAEIVVKIGDIITTPCNSNDTAGYVIAVADRHEDAVSRCVKAVNSINVETEKLV
jgi:biotin carboxylase